MPGTGAALSPSGLVSTSRARGSSNARQCIHATQLEFRSKSDGRSARHRQCRPLAAAARDAAGAGRQPVRESLVAAGPPTHPPDYTAIDGQLLNRAVYGLFRRRMVQAIGSDSQLDGYELCASNPPASSCLLRAMLSLLHAPLADLQLVSCCCRYPAIIDLTRRLNAMHGSPRGTQEATRGILRSLFPAWLPPAFAALFSRPLPELSCQVEGMVGGLLPWAEACRGSAGGKGNGSGGLAALQSRLAVKLHVLAALSLLPLAAHPPPAPAPTIPLCTLPQQLNAWATWLTCQWLMGECEVNDVEVDGGRLGRAHGVLVKR